MAWKAILGSLTSGRDRLSILEVGTGTGFLAFLLVEMDHQVTGMDISTGMLARAREKASKLGYSVSFQEADAEYTGFPDETFDLVVCRHVIWNLPHPDIAIEEWVRVTKPGGVVGVIDGIFPAVVDRWREPYRAVFEKLPMVGGVEPEKIDALMKGKGLTNIRTEWLDSLVSIKRHTLADYSSNRYLVAGTKP
jgi:ubiquinone/menaquinone biosynthesis C-methylase UbiE